MISMLKNYVIIPKLKRTGDNSRYLVDNFTVTRLLLDELEVVTYPICGSVNGVIELYVPQLKILNSGLVNSSYATLERIELPSIETMSSTALNMNTLREIVLKEGFKFDLTLSNCYRLNLTSAKDILNKCAQLNEDEKYTIIFDETLRYALTSEDIAIATNKGWEVKFE